MQRWGGYGGGAAWEPTFERVSWADCAGDVDLEARNLNLVEVKDCYSLAKLPSFFRYMSFRALGLDANILKAVQESGYTEPTPIQAAAIPQILAGHHLIGIAQTGTGKTAAFVLPILAKLAATNRSGGPARIPALIIAPTREFVVQIHA